MSDDDMCDNRVTPWKCNGPHDGLTLTDFLLARITEDERSAKMPGLVRLVANHPLVGVSLDDDDEDAVLAVDPARVLAECEAKRRIVEYARAVQDGLESAFPDDAGEWVIERHLLSTLALPYADHPDYREEWRP